MHRYRPVSVEFPTHVAGVPCRVLAHITPDCPPTLHDPGSPLDVEITVLDRRGYRARWLERRLDTVDRRRIEIEALEADADRANPY